jgi:hypothetical protein
MTLIETTPYVETGTPQLCSILAIVNAGSPRRRAGFSGVAVNALSKERAATFALIVLETLHCSLELTQFTMSGLCRL